MQQINLKKHKRFVKGEIKIYNEPGNTGVRFHSSVPEPWHLAEKAIEKLSQVLQNELNLIAKTAIEKGWTKFVASQSYYTITSRDIEREIVPIAISENISITPRSTLACGFLSGKFTRNNEVAGDS
ncbi:MAG: aldo/keto reductase [Prolixibacteraceae bacterium]|jgi:aryl-alcohol dehydrogenase-like predicted oxidoreductase|nr:aldo/keto reductase [Prolixibacteraceae bacterium]